MHHPKAIHHPETVNHPETWNNLIDEHIYNTIHLIIFCFPESLCFTIPQTWSSSRLASPYRSGVTLSSDYELLKVAHLPGNKQPLIYLLASTTKYSTHSIFPLLLFPSFLFLFFSLLSFPFHLFSVLQSIQSVFPFGRRETWVSMVCDTKSGTRLMFLAKFHLISCPIEFDDLL